MRTETMPHKFIVRSLEIMEEEGAIQPGWTAENGLYTFRAFGAAFGNPPGFEVQVDAENYTAFSNGYELGLLQMARAIENKNRAESNSQRERVQMDPIKAACDTLQIWENMGFIRPDWLVTESKDELKPTIVRFALADGSEAFTWELDEFLFTGMFAAKALMYGHDMHAYRQEEEEEEDEALPSSLFERLIRLERWGAIGEWVLDAAGGVFYIDDVFGCPGSATIPEVFAQTCRIEQGWLAARVKAVGLDGLTEEEREIVDRSRRTAAWNSAPREVRNQLAPRPGMPSLEEIREAVEEHNRKLDENNN